MATRYLVYRLEKDPAFHSLGKRERNTRHTALGGDGMDGRPFASALRRKRSVSLPDPPCNGGPFCVSPCRLVSLLTKPRVRGTKETLAVLSIHYGFTFLREMTLSFSLERFLLSISPEKSPKILVARRKRKRAYSGNVCFFRSGEQSGELVGRDPIGISRRSRRAGRKTDFSFPRSWSAPPCAPVPAGVHLGYRKFAIRLF